MEILDYIEKKKALQRRLIDYLDSGDNIEEKYQNFLELYDQQKISEDRYELEEFLHLIVIISNYHHRLPNFFNKIFNIIAFLKPIIQKYYTNDEIFTIFKKNKRVLLYIIESKMITVNSYIATTLSDYFHKNTLYTNYFFNEIKSFIKDEKLLKIVEYENSINPKNFEENRKIGENDEYICQLIRDDKIDEFISYVSRNSISLHTVIDKSIFETNNFILDKYINPNLIEYAAFFGSSQIFKYLYLNGAKLTSSVWDYAIYGDDEEIVHILENEGIPLDTFILFNSYGESIKGHHIHTTNYLLDNLNNDEAKKEELRNDFYMTRIQELNEYPGFDAFKCYTIIPSIKYHNYYFFPKELDDPFNFGYLCKYNYINLVNLLLKTKKINVNQKIISKKNILME